MEAACKDSAHVACWSRPGRGVCRCETHQGYRGWVNRRLAYNKMRVGKSSMKECFRRRAAVPLLSRHYLQARVWRCMRVSLGCFVCGSLPSQWLGQGENELVNSRSKVLF